MGVRRLQYSQELERKLAKGEDVEQAHNKAANKSSAKQTKKKPKHRLANLARKLKELRYGKNMPMDEKQKKLRRRFENKLKAMNKRNKSNSPTDKEKAEYKRLGGGQTKEGRAYRRKWMEKHGG